MATLFVEQLSVIDCSYLHTQRGLLGESWIVDIELTGPLNDQGMVFDFGDVKRSIKNAIDSFADHKLIVPLKAPELVRYEHHQDRIELEFVDQQGHRFVHQSPATAVCAVDSQSIDTDTLRTALLEPIAKVLPANVDETKMILRTETSGPMFQYSHGLKKHEGNCQRIAHGHRSRVEIWENGKRSPKWERYWADQWRDIYIVSSQDRLEERDNDYRLAYSAPQGDFLLELPKQRCYLVEGESTVEQIAIHLARQMQRLVPGSQFRVRVFEGVNKGAVADTPIDDDQPD